MLYSKADEHGLALVQLGVSCWPDWQAHTCTVQVSLLAIYRQALKHRCRELLALLILDSATSLSVYSRQQYVLFDAAFDAAPVTVCPVLLHVKPSGAIVLLELNQPFTLVNY